MAKNHKHVIDDIYQLCYAAISVFTETVSKNSNKTDAQYLNTKATLELLCDFVAVCSDCWNKEGKKKHDFIIAALTRLCEDYRDSLSSCAAGSAFLSCLKDALPDVGICVKDLQGDAQALKKQFYEDINNKKNADPIDLFVAFASKDLWSKLGYHDQLLIIDSRWNGTQKLFGYLWNRSLLFYHFFRGSTDTYIEQLDAALYLALKSGNENIIIDAANAFRNSSGYVLFALKIRDSYANTNEYIDYDICRIMAERLNVACFDKVFTGCKKNEHEWQELLLDSSSRLLVLAMKDNQLRSENILNEVVDRFIAICCYIRNKYPRLLDKVLQQFLELGDIVGNSELLQMALLDFCTNILEPQYNYNVKDDRLRELVDKYKLTDVDLLFRYAELLKKHPDGDKNFEPGPDYVRAALCYLTPITSYPIYDEWLTKPQSRVNEFTYDQVRKRKEFHEKQYDSCLASIIGIVKNNLWCAQDIMTAITNKLNLSTMIDPMHSSSRLLLDISYLMGQDSYQDALFRFVAPSNCDIYDYDKLELIFSSVNERVVDYYDNEHFSCQTNEDLAKLWRKRLSDPCDIDAILDLAEYYLELQDARTVTQSHLIARNLLRWVFDKKSPLYKSINKQQRMRGQFLFGKLLYEIEVIDQRKLGLNGLKYEAHGESQAFCVLFKLWLQLIPILDDKYEKLEKDTRLLLYELLQKTNNYFANEEVYCNEFPPDEETVRDWGDELDYYSQLVYSLLSHYKKSDELNYGAEVSKTKNVANQLFDAFDYFQANRCDLDNFEHLQKFLGIGRVLAENGTLIFDDLSIDVFIVIINYDLQDELPDGDSRLEIIGTAINAVLTKGVVQSLESKEIVKSQLTPKVLFDAYKLDIDNIYAGLLSDYFLKIMHTTSSSVLSSTEQKMIAIRKEAAKCLLDMNLSAKDLPNSVTSLDGVKTACNLMLTKDVCARFPWCMLSVVTDAETLKCIDDDMMYCHGEMLKKAYRLFYYLDKGVVESGLGYDSNMHEAQLAVEGLLNFYQSMQISGVKLIQNIQEKIDCINNFIGDGDAANRTAFAKMLNRLLCENSLCCVIECNEISAKTKEGLQPQSLLSHIIENLIISKKLSVIPEQIRQFNIFVLRSQSYLDADQLVRMFHLNILDIDDEFVDAVNNEITNFRAIVRCFNFNGIFSLQGSEVKKMQGQLNKLVVRDDEYKNPLVQYVVYSNRVGKFNLFLSKQSIEWFNAELSDDFDMNLCDINKLAFKYLLYCSKDHAYAFNEKKSKKLADEKERKLCKSAADVVASCLILRQYGRLLDKMKMNREGMLSSVVVLFQINALYTAVTGSSEKKSACLWISGSKKLRGVPNNYHITVNGLNGSLLLQNGDRPYLKLRLSNKVTSKRITYEESLLRIMPVLALYFGFNELKVECFDNEYPQKKFLAEMKTKLDQYVRETTKKWSELLNADKLPNMAGILKLLGLTNIACSNNNYKPSNTSSMLGVRTK